MPDPLNPNDYSELGPWGWVKFWVFHIVPPDQGPTAQQVHSTHAFDDLGICRRCNKTFGELFMERIKVCTRQEHSELSMRKPTSGEGE